MPYEDADNVAKRGSVSDRERGSGAKRTEAVPSGFRYSDEKEHFLARTNDAKAQQRRAKRPNSPGAVPRVYTPIFIGALLQDDGSFVAFIADPATGQLATFRAGDALPMSAGSIKEISLDDLTVTAADHSTKKIAMGQNILGGSAEYPAAPAAEGVPLRPPRMGRWKPRLTAAAVGMRLRRPRLVKRRRERPTRPRNPPPRRLRLPLRLLPRAGLRVGFPVKPCWTIFVAVGRSN